ncbi:DNA helicase IV [Poriferisphaera corsica]|uniref:DNA 3'-5' helicase n=1 Tax=Poriferisphaera corsica TaxID=2528020 RepID=A0A517YS18_9BACT|nr:UvrD-helicase domain-containing protein [Poriferisphaera corsica]QDU33019.1 DNA helicase IV [Poriferisphaera corsica]
MDITCEQRAIIQQAETSRAMIFAGPGTGKTEIVARRLNHLLKDCSLKPSQILVLSFSRAAVKALVKRIQLLGSTDSDIIEDLRYLSVRTFDSWSFRILRFLGKDPNDLLRNGFDKNIYELVQVMSDSGADLLSSQCAKQFKNIRHIIVDEAQDLSGIRAELVKELLKMLVSKSKPESCGFTLLADPNQSIYEWAYRESNENGLTSTDLFKWAKSYYQDLLKIFKLKKNHRSSSKIAKFVQEISDCIDECETNNVSPLPLLDDMFADYMDVDDGNILHQLPDSNGASTAILCRSNSQIINTAIKLRDNQEINGFTFNVGTPPKNLPIWIAALLHPLESDVLTQRQFFRIVECYAKQLLGGEIDKHATWQKLLRFSRLNEEGRSISIKRLAERINWPDSLPDDENFDHSPVVVSTVHQVKGLEFDNVTLLNFANNTANKFQNSSELEESRIQFVALSRARFSVTHFNDDNLETNDFYKHNFQRRTRSRWYRRLHYKKSHHHILEIGQEVDVYKESFVDTQVLGNADNVKKLQQFLLHNHEKIIGCNIELVRTKLPDTENCFVYNIVLQGDSEFGGKVVGQTTEQLTKDILRLKNSRQTLPYKIYDLKVNAISTFASTHILDSHIPKPWQQSHLWLGVQIHGFGSFSTFWSKRK